MIIRTADDDGSPICPIDENPVFREGEFCSPDCWQHFHIVVMDETNIIQMGGYLDLEEQPWHIGEPNG